MKTIKVKTQAELDTALQEQQKDKTIEIEIRSDPGEWFTAYGSSQVRASKQVAVTSSGNAKVQGGVEIKYKKPSNTKEWLDEYGVEAKDGIVILYKAVTDGWKSGYGMVYAPGTTPVAPDWDGLDRECGGGLHFCALPVIALGFHQEATKFVACPVRVDEIVVHPNADFPNKIKAPRVIDPGCWEVDINGNKI